MALKSSKEKNPIIFKLKQKIHTILGKGIQISFLWVPSHVCIAENELADELAKASLSEKNINDMKFPYSDYKHVISEHFDDKWHMQHNESYNILCPNQHAVRLIVRRTFSQKDR